MKKLFAIFSVFCIVCVVISSAFDNMHRAQLDAIKNEVNPSTDMVYTIKSENDRIVVYYGESLYLKTDTSIHTLPKKDRHKFISGFTVDSRAEVDKILFDYCS